MLDDPAWFGAVMGSAATAAVAAQHPGHIDALSGFANVTAVLLLVASVLLFLMLFVRDFVVRGWWRNLSRQLRSPRTGPAYATIPGAINVLAVAAIAVWPQIPASTPGWSVLLVMAGIGAGLGLWLTVIFFVSAFEHERFEAQDISGIWFIPETVILLGALLFADLASYGSPDTQRSLAVVSIGLLGAGGLLFAFTAALFVNRLILHPGVHRTGAPAMWIMISPLAVTSMALQAVARGDGMLGGSWAPAIGEVSTFAAGLLWGFALWWTAAAAVVTRHVGRAAFTRSAADWGFVFPAAAMVIATLTLARQWESAVVEAVGLILGVLLALVWIGVATSAVMLFRGRGAGSPDEFRAG